MKKILFVAALLAAMGSSALAGDVKVFNVMDYGAVPDGKTLCTEAVQKAIDEAGKKGGKVVVPKGTYLIAPISMRSGVELCVERYATLLGTTDVDKWRTEPGKQSIKAEFIAAYDLENIAFTGEGTINAQGRQFAIQLDSLHYVGQWDRWNKNTHVPDGRPHLFNIYNCKNVRLQDITVSNSAAWTVSILNSEDIHIEGVKVDADYFWNNDGIDITDCKNVVVRYCDVSAADDGLCLKSEDPKLCCENILMERCRVRSSASAIKFGTSCHGGFKNITVRDMVVYDTYRSAIALEAVDGGFLEDVLIENFVVTNTLNAIFLRLGHRHGRPDWQDYVQTEQDKNHGYSTLKNVVIRDITAKIPFGQPDLEYDQFGPTVDSFKNAMPASITGLPGHPVENVLIENVNIIMPGKGNPGQRFIPYTRPDQIDEKAEAYPEYDMFRELPAWGMYIRHAEGITFRNVTFSAMEKDYRPCFVVDDVDGLNMEGVKIYEADDDPQITLHNVRNEKVDFDKSKVVIVE